MTKLSSKTHIFLIISVLIIAIGMALGTVFHFTSGEFFNYGDEFNDYSSVTVSYLMAEQSEEDIDKICKAEFGDLKPIEISYAKDVQGTSTNEIIYKFSAGADSTKIENAVKSINSKISSDDGLSVAAYHKAKTLVGGSKVLIFTSIAIGSAVAFEILYLAIRYRKLGMVLAALAAQVNNFGLYAALLAATRIPVGIEGVAFSIIAVVLTAITSCVYFDKVKFGIKNGSYNISTVGELVDQSAQSTYKLNAALCAATAVAIIIVAVFATIAYANALILAVYAVALIAVLVCWYGFSMFTPALYGGFAKLDVKKARA